ncbi:hypothetical protein B0I35DRAFT_510149 [Stachybotrys elegans]|uniref:Uncharacterized protein n=1 Tax=Stachybotrys elegans TaxID=80388 RepID=A0A8K0SWG8_9HYPO|nr:hypothetical protein B0I35DRAFT_510149 [Stachybotrys elegans]
MSDQGGTSEIPPRWKFPRIHWVPAWTNPAWRDTGRVREGSDFRITDGLFDLVRPALRAEDLEKHPTEFAKRFGIFPGRNDGRSRASPVPETLQPCSALNADILKDVGDVFDPDGSQLGLLIEANRLKDRDDEQYLREYEAARVDERWQQILFGDMTMRELIDGDHFVMDDAKHDLFVGDIDPLLARDRWISKNNTVLSSIDGRRMILDPTTNDDLWKSMEPALLLASKILQVDEPYYTAVQDVHHLCYMDLSPDRTGPSAPYSDQDILDGGRREITRKLNPTTWNSIASVICAATGCKPSLDPVKAGQAVLRRHLKFKLGSGYHIYDETEKFEKVYTQGVTKTSLGENDDMTIVVGADVVWPLLSSQYTKSEKMMISHVLAITIAHEIMHAWELAAVRWLAYPQLYGISAADDIELCTRMFAELTKVSPGDSDADITFDHYFEKDAVAETGHSFEHHVLGGGVWPLKCNDTQAGPVFLATYAGINLRSQWAFEARKFLDNAHPSRPRGFMSFSQVKHIARVFENNFWAGPVQKYGMAAWRVAPQKLSKVRFCPNDTFDLVERIGDVTVADEEDRKWLEEFLRGLRRDNFLCLLQYIISTVTEATDFELLLWRIFEDSESWSSRDDCFQAIWGQMDMIICEIQATGLCLNFGQSEAAESSEGRQIRGRWEQAFSRNDQKYPDELSERFGNDFFSAAMRTKLDTHKDRLLKRLMHLSWMLEDEQTTQHGLLSDIYSFPLKYFGLYERHLPGHLQAWQMRQRRLQLEIMGLIKNLGFISDFIPEVKSEWMPKLASSSTGCSSILQVLDMDETHVHTNWRSCLVTVPLLRQCGRRPRDKWEFLAKVEMRKLTGKRLAELQRFERAFEDFLGDGGLSIMEDRVPDLDQRWNDILRDMVARESAWPRNGPTYFADTIRINVAGPGVAKEKVRESLIWKQAQVAAERFQVRVQRRNESLEVPHGQPAIETPASGSLRAQQIAPKVEGPLIEDAAGPFGCNSRPLQSPAQPIDRREVVGRLNEPPSADPFYVPSAPGTLDRHIYTMSKDSVEELHDGFSGLMDSLDKTLPQPVPGGNRLRHLDVGILKATQEYDLDRLWMRENVLTQPTTAGRRPQTRNTPSKREMPSGNHGQAHRIIKEANITAPDSKPATPKITSRDTWLYKKVVTAEETTQHSSAGRTTKRKRAITIEVNQSFMIDEEVEKDGEEDGEEDRDSEETEIGKDPVIKKRRLEG